MNKLELQSIVRIKSALSKIPSHNNIYDFGGVLSSSQDFTKGTNLAIQALTQIINANIEEDSKVRKEYRDDILPYVEALEKFVAQRESEKWGSNR